MIHSTLFSVALLCISAADQVPAARLTVTNPKVSGDQVTFVVALEGDAVNGVSTMTFQVKYEPDVFEPVSVKPGKSASSAEKMVQGKAGKKGAYSVIVAGVNKNKIEKGDVAELTFKINGKAKEAKTRETKITIAATSFASPEGTVVPSQGSDFTLKLIADDVGKAAQKPVQK